MDAKQFKKNIKWINKQLQKDYPGAQLRWLVDEEPEIIISDELVDQQNSIINRTQELIRECGGDAEFYPEKAYYSE